MCSGSGVRQNWVGFSVLPVISTITLSELSNLSELQSPVLQNGMTVFSPRYT